MEWSTTDVAKHLGMTSSRVGQLANDGLFEKTGRGKYSSEQCVLAYVQKLQAKISADEDERARLDRLKADKIEIEIAEMQGELISSTEAMDAWGKIVQSVRSRILAMPTKIAPLMVGTKSVSEASDILKRSAYETLKELANPNFIEHALGIRKEKRERNKKRRQ